VIYGLGPYIADYPEQALLACIVQNWCPKYVSHLSLNWSRYLTSSRILRCTALPTSLDAMGAVPRTHVHTDVLVNGRGIELQELWDDYGIVGDIIVSLLSMSSGSFLTFPTHACSHLQQDF
jgi:hypothetical protein